MSGRVLGTGKLPIALLREVIDSGRPAPPDVLLPPRIGEDAGVVETKAGALIVASDPVTLTGSGVGAHAALVNANDIAVMGARPRWFTATILLPAGTTEGDVRTLFRDMHAALEGLDVVLLGGHAEITPKVSQTIVVGQMLGLREDGVFVTTGGAEPGDVVLQIGLAPVEGAAVLAVEAAGERLKDVPEATAAKARGAVTDPGISVVTPALRATELGAKALHDPTEGGLSSGLYELAEASGLALRVDRDAALWFEPGLAVCAALGADPWGTLASGALLAAFAAQAAPQAKAALEADGHPVAVIARAEPGEGVHLDDGTPLPRYVRDEVVRVLE